MKSDRPSRSSLNSAGQPGPLSGPLPKTPVLIVEDEQRLREMLVRAVGEMGYPVAGVGSAEAALRALEREEYGTLVLDLNLPGMEGMTLLAAVRKRWQTIQAIILTGFGDLEAAKQAIHLDVVDFLTKPCALGDLEIALDRARRRAGPRLPEVELTGDEDFDDEEDDDYDEEAEPADSRSSDAGDAGEKGAAGPAGGAAGGLEFSPRESSEAMSMEEIERQHILAALQKHGGNRNAAAAELNISLRKLYYRLAQYQKQGKMT